MAFKQIVTAVTAIVDTTKTLVDTVTVPDGVKALVGFAGTSCGGATLTSAEGVTGYWELESDDIPIVPAQFLMDSVVILTSGTTSVKPTQWPCNIPVKQGNRIKVYARYDMAQTGALTGRAQLTFA